MLEGRNIDTIPVVTEFPPGGWLIGFDAQSQPFRLEQRQASSVPRRLLKLRSTFMANYAAALAAPNRTFTSAGAGSIAALLSYAAVSDGLTRTSGIQTSQYVVDTSRLQHDNVNNDQLLFSRLGEQGLLELRIAAVIRNSAGGSYVASSYPTQSQMGWRCEISDPQSYNFPIGVEPMQTFWPAGTTNHLCGRGSWFLDDDWPEDISIATWLRTSSPGADGYIDELAVDLLWYPVPYQVPGEEEGEPV